MKATLDRYLASLGAEYKSHGNNDHPAYEMYVNDIRVIAYARECDGLLVISAYYPDDMRAACLDRIGELLHWINANTHGAKWGIDLSNGEVSCSATLLFEEGEPPVHAVDAMFRACIASYMRFAPAVMQVAVDGVTPTAAIRAVSPAFADTKLGGERNSSSLRGVVEQFFVEAKIEATTIPHAEVLGWAFRIGDFTFLISLNETTGFLFVRASIPEAAPPPMWSRIAELLARINDAASNAMFVLDFDDGAISCWTSLVCGSSVLPLEVFANMVQACHVNIQTFAEPIWLVLHSPISPADALSRVRRGP